MASFPDCFTVIRGDPRLVTGAPGLAPGAPRCSQPRRWRSQTCCPRSQVISNLSQSLPGTPAVFLSGQARPAFHRPGRAALWGLFSMSAGPGRQALDQACRLFRSCLHAFSWGPGGFSSRKKPKQIILFERSSAAFTKNVSKVRNINHLQFNYRSPAIAVFNLSTTPWLMQTDARILNDVQTGMLAGRLVIQAGAGGL